jgi:hypothetical protein
MEEDLLMVKAEIKTQALIRNTYVENDLIAKKVADDKSEVS